MHIFLLPLLLLLPVVSTEVKMVKIFGRVPNDDPKDGKTVPMEECIDGCFDSSDCLLAFMDSDGNCLLYNYNTTESVTVVETAPEDGFYVAFKTTLAEDTCPSSYLDIQFSVTVRDETLKWTRSADGWLLKRCIGGWKRFERADGVVVCMETFNLTRGISLAASEAFCTEMGYVLTGVASVEEAAWILARIREMMPGLASIDGFWIDGHRNCLDDAICSATNFVWTDGYTTGQGAFGLSNTDFSINYGGQSENCLSVTFITNLPDVTLNDVSCSMFDRARGAVCGYRLE